MKDVTIDIASTGFPSQFVSDAITLTMFGMGFVFIFLALMVVVTNVMSLILAKIQPITNDASALDSDSIIQINEKSNTAG